MRVDLLTGEVGPSLIAGRGVRATVAVTAGLPVVRFAGVPTSLADLGPVNHSCDPTLGWADGVTLTARVDVAVDTELTLDYATVITDPDFTLWCHCETYRCRQVVEGGDWRIPQLQQRYAGIWSPSVQALIAP